METLRCCLMTVALLSLAACAGDDDAGTHYVVQAQPDGACVVPFTVTALDVYEGGDAVLSSTEGDAVVTWHRADSALWLSPATFVLGKWSMTPAAFVGDVASVALVGEHGYSCMYTLRLQ